MAAVLGFGPGQAAEQPPADGPTEPPRAELPCLEDRVSPYGYRMLAMVPRIPRPAVDSLIEHFGGLQKLLAASVEDLDQVPGVGASHARIVREGLSRLAESSILDRYV